MVFFSAIFFRNSLHAYIKSSEMLINTGVFAILSLHKAYIKPTYFWAYFWILMGLKLCFLTLYPPMRQTSACLSAPFTLSLAMKFSREFHGDPYSPRPLLRTSSRNSLENFPSSIRQTTCKDGSPFVRPPYTNPKNHVIRMLFM